VTGIIDIIMVERKAYGSNSFMRHELRCGLDEVFILSKLCSVGSNYFLVALQPTSSMKVCTLRD